MMLIFQYHRLDSSQPVDYDNEGFAPNKNQEEVRAMTWLPRLNFT
jgi:hypothetical protein